ncbi:kinesin [Chloropicon primus]|uniref:Kinesin-like protein n=1 Tax=Chloropicon primus TaxID=1764295 RepID=A0A5B8MX42_9CHLO|nr:kinesin [Chloropicon primus]UPR04364.1 kinesin [Chloropicon primus]|eukprot:QDZ25159.1 kinesin [Chloropicon primus]
MAGKKKVGVGSNAAECVKVVVRCRPLSQGEVGDGKKGIVNIDTKLGQIAIKNPKLEEKEPAKNFTFDIVYNWNTEQITLYQETASPIVDSCLEGYNGTIFCYGQTGTGKTFTMEGNLGDDKTKGIIPNAFDHVFRAIETSQDDKKFLVRASFLEIYNEEVRDLLSKNSANTKLELKENVDTGVYVKNLTSFVVKGVSEIHNVLAVGKKNRTVGTTLMNRDSSRSHSIFTIVIECSETVNADSGDSKIRVGKLNLVDLAGSERQSKTGATGERLKEATKINLSLSALGNVISALVDGRSGHIPYRDSKLTRLLQDSLGGNTKTVMVANIGPADYNYDETMSTLRYANRAKNIKNKPRINEDPKDAMLREFQTEIARLKAQLQNAGNPEAPRAGPTEAAEVSQADKEQIKREVEQEMRSKGADLLSPESKRRLEEESEERCKEVARNLMKEQEALKEESKRIAMETERAQQETASQQQQLEEARKRKLAIENRVKLMEAKLLQGERRGGLLEDTKAKEREVLSFQRKLAERKMEEQEHAQKIAELEEQALYAEDNYATVQDEASSKTKKLKKLLHRYKATKNEIEEVACDFQSEKEDLLESVRFLNRQLQLKNKIISSFIPIEETKKVMKRAQWDEEKDAWLLERLSNVSESDNSANMKRPQSASGAKRPVSEYAKVAAALGDQNPRFKGENILVMELDLPDRTTYDYDEDSVGDAQAALDTILHSEQRQGAGNILPLDNISVNSPSFTDDMSLKLKKDEKKKRMKMRRMSSIM